MNRKLLDAPLQALFACAMQTYAEEVSWPAEDLYWCAEHKIWLCAECLEYLGLEKGVDLKTHLLRADPPIRGFL